MPPTELPTNPYEGLAIKPDGTPYNFGFVPCFLWHEWMAMAEGIATSLVERAGGRISSYDSDLDVHTEIASLQDLMTRGVDSIIINPVDTAASVPMIEQVYDAGIPIFDFDMIAQTEKLTGLSTHDQFEMGVIAGDWVVNLVESTGEPLIVYEIWGVMQHEGCIRRHNGFHSVVDGHELITVVESPNTNFQAVEAMHAVTDAFSAHPEYGAIMSQGGMGEGYMEALRGVNRLYEIGHPEHVLVFNMNEDPEAYKYMTEGYMDACCTHGSWIEVDIAVKQMFTYVILGQPVPRKIWIPVRFLSAEDIAWQPYIDGKMRGVDYDLWPVLPTPGLIPTPTKE